MQPHYSVDHETRQNLFQADEETQSRTTEETPLLYRFPQTAVPLRSTATTLIVSVLLLILISGVIIGIYLLILQSDSENVLPPVEMPLQLVSKAQWDHVNQSQLLLSNHSPFKAGKLIIVHTESEQCSDTKSCTKLLRNMQANAAHNVLPYNFLISSNGQTYEALGWYKPSSMFPEISNALVLAFIGNFTDEEPTVAQKLEAKNFVAESISHRYLEPSFVLIGKSTKSIPKRLFWSMNNMPQWNNDLSDQI
ncbi:hypothetical protein K1T71_000331 [Dendrolimus kikuchii]|uniref:Uncharacterized protein n=1 Tax=Dendrolimus kikuchii TaxID=765133 RepID=A0ACC1DIY0_9NEOP|nr:hypothetical protein K1T71_000331 [Dendrolimus kikuchii]